MKKAVISVLILIIPLLLCINTSAQTYEFSFEGDESADGLYEEYLDNDDVNSKYTLILRQKECHFDDIKTY